MVERLHDCQPRWTLRGAGEGPVSLLGDLRLSMVSSVKQSVIEIEISQLRDKYTEELESGGRPACGGFSHFRPSSLDPPIGELQTV